MHCDSVNEANATKLGEYEIPPMYHTKHRIIHKSASSFSKSKGKDNRLTEILASNRSSRKLVRIAAAVCAPMFNFPIGQPRGKSGQKRSDGRIDEPDLINFMSLRSIDCPTVARERKKKQREDRDLAMHLLLAVHLQSTPSIRACNASFLHLSSIFSHLSVLPFVLSCSRSSQRPILHFEYCE